MEITSKKQKAKKRNEQTEILVCKFYKVQIWQRNSQDCVKSYTTNPMQIVTISIETTTTTAAAAAATMNKLMNKIILDTKCNVTYTMVYNVHS